MEISINTNINLFRKNIAEAINVSQLPVGVLYYLLKDILSEVGNIYEETLKKESEEIQKQLEKEEKEDIKENQE